MWHIKQNAVYFCLNSWRRATLRRARYGIF